MGDVLGCDVYIDGALFQDGREGNDFASPLALDGLRVAWGRETTIDQPEPSTCEFEVMDVPGGAAFMTEVYIGASVEVRSTVEVDTGGEPGQRYQTLPDVSFNDTAPGETPPNVRPAPNNATSAAVVAEGDDHRLAIDRSAVAYRTTRADIAPGAIVSGDPDAWADMPRVGDGSTWSYTIDALVPAAGSVDVRGLYIYDPAMTRTARADAVSGMAATSDGTSTSGQSWGSYASTDGFVLTAPEPAWLGLQVTFVYAQWDTWPEDTHGMTWDDVPADMTWNHLGRSRVDNAELFLHEAAPTNELVVFAGAVTDLEVEWDESLPPAGGARLKVTAANFTAQTNNYYIGDAVWNAEPMSTRFQRVVNLLNAEIPGGWGFGSIIAPTLGPTRLGYQDVDNQSAYSLLQSFAESVDGVLWPAVHLTSPRRFFYVEDINARESGIVLMLDPDTGYVVVDTSGAMSNERTQLSACYVLRDPVSFKQSTEDVTTRVAVQWEQQGTDGEGKPTATQRTVELVDTEAEARLGVRRVQTSTLLQSEDDATEHAERKLRRLTSDAWRADGVVWDLSIYTERGQGWPIEVQDIAADLLDGTTRIGLPLTITDLPAWTPSGETLPVYVEGGTYEFTGGRWVLSLIVSNVYGSGSSAAWDELPEAWRWDDFAPGVTWNDLYGATVAPTP